MVKINPWLFIGRKPDGSVRILQFFQAPATEPTIDRFYAFGSEVSCDITIPPGQWASAVCGVSAAGNAPDRFYQAQAFHMNPPQAEPQPMTLASLPALMLDPRPFGHPGASSK